MKKAMKWGLSIVGLLVVLVVGAVIVLPMVVDVNQYKPKIEALVSEQTGRSFTMGDDIDLSVFPWVGVRLTDVALGNAKGFKAGQMVSVKSFEVRLKVMPLFSKQIEVASFILDSPKIALEKNKAGTGNWENIGPAGGSNAADAGKKTDASSTAAASQGLPISSLSVGRCAIVNGTLSYTDAASGMIKTVSDLNVELTDISLDKPVKLDLSALVDGKPVSLSGSAGPIGSNPGKENMTVDLALKALDTLSLTIKGSLLLAEKTPGVDAAIAVDPFSPRVLFEKLGQPFPVETQDATVLTKVSLAASLKGSAQSVSLSDGKLMLDDSTLTFTAGAKAFDKPDIRFDLSLDKIDADRYLPPKKEESGDTNAAGASGSAGGSTASSGGGASSGIDYTPLRKLVLDGKAAIGEFKVANLTMTNVTAHVTGPNGYHSDQNTAWYAMRARGGFGLIITECVVMNPHRWGGQESLNPSLLIDERYYRYHSEMTEMLHHFSGCKVCIQLSPGWGRQGHPHADSRDCPAGAPSAIPLQVDMRNLNKGWERQVKRLSPEIAELVPDFDVLRNMNDEEYASMLDLVIAFVAENTPELLHIMFGDPPRELTIPEIVDLEDRFAVQAQAAFKLGYDALEVHAPHGYLMHQFLSPRSNHRHDIYGGSLENRARFITNTVMKTREKIGPDKPLGVRLSGDELMPGGLTHKEVVKVVDLCKKAGANFFNISQGSYENPGAAFAPDGENEFTRWAPGFKEAAGDVPVIAPNFITPEAALGAVESGSVDIVSLGRQAIADPFWPAKVKEGRLDDIVKCIRCQRCYMDLMTANWARCSVNPMVGKEKHFPEMFMDTPKLQKKIDRFKEKAMNLPQI